ncbi:MAG TPA: hypothetical protein VJ124_00605 [Pyrinomonadaceae bacterium]|nr:hypothetical protein [Pyrinomonadaceae bacterium]
MIEYLSTRLFRRSWKELFYQYLYDFLVALLLFVICGMFFSFERAFAWVPVFVVSSIMINYAVLSLLVYYQHLTAQQAVLMRARAKSRFQPHATPFARTKSLPRILRFFSNCGTLLWSGYITDFSDHMLLARRATLLRELLYPIVYCVGRGARKEKIQAFYYPSDYGTSLKTRVSLLQQSKIEDSEFKYYSLFFLSGAKVGEIKNSIDANMLKEMFFTVPRFFSPGESAKREHRVFAKVKRIEVFAGPVDDSILAVVVIFDFKKRMSPAQQNLTVESELLFHDRIFDFFHTTYRIKNSDMRFQDLGYRAAPDQRAEEAVTRSSPIQLLLRAILRQ